MRVSLSQPDNFLSFITSPHIVATGLTILPASLKTIKWQNSGNTQHHQNDDFPAYIVEHYFQAFKQVVNASYSVSANGNGAQVATWSRLHRRRRCENL